MKQLTTIFTLLIALLLATSCSQDELPGSESTDEPGQVQTYTFTVSADLTMEGEAETRATYDDDDKPTRCFLQVYDASGTEPVTQPINGTVNNGTYTFTVTLAAHTTYQFLFWADNSDATVTDLKNVPYQIGKVAFATMIQDEIEDVTNVTLKHVVAKVTLQSTAETALTMSKNVTFTTNCATAYNVSGRTIVSSGSQTYSATLTSDVIPTNGEALSCYLIPTNSTQNVNISVNLLSQTIQNVNLAADTRYMLRGDLSTRNANWTVTEAYREKAFTSCFFDENGNPKGTPDTGMSGTYHFYGTVEDVKRLFESFLQINYPEKGDDYIELFGMVIQYITNENFAYLTIDYEYEYFIYYSDLGYQQFEVPKVP